MPYVYKTHGKKKISQGILENILNWLKITYKIAKYLASHVFPVAMQNDTTNLENGLAISN